MQGEQPQAAGGSGRVRKVKPKSRRLQVYFDPAIPSERMILEVWDSADATLRVQDLFRVVIATGIRTMVAQGTMPDSVIEDVPGLRS